MQETCVEFIKGEPTLSSQALVASLTAWMARYNAHIIFCRAETFTKLCREILYREAKEILTNMEVDGE